MGRGGQLRQDKVESTGQLARLPLCPLSGLLLARRSWGWVFTLECGDLRRLSSFLRVQESEKNTKAAKIAALQSEKVSVQSLRSPPASRPITPGRRAPSREACRLSGKGFARCWRIRG